MKRMSAGGRHAPMPGVRGASARGCAGLLFSAKGRYFFFLPNVRTYVTKDLIWSLLSVFLNGGMLFLPFEI